MGEMRPKKSKSPRFVSEAQKTTRYGSPPLHERTFPRSLPRKRGRCREAIGMGFAYHCVYLSFHSHMIFEIRQYPRVTVTADAYIPFVLSVLVMASRTALKINYGWRAVSQTPRCSC